MLFWRYCKDIQTSYYGYFEHTWLHTPKMIVSTCRRLRCLSVCQKQTSSIAFSLRYYILKNAAIWLADSILAHNWRARILPDVGLLVISTTILVSISDYFQEKLMTKFFNESTKPYLGAILDPFCPNLGRNEFSWKKELCQFLDIPIIYHCTNYWAISEKKRQTDRWTDGYSDRQADRNDCSRFIKCSLGKKKWNTPLSSF